MPLAACAVCWVLLSLSWPLPTPRQGRRACWGPPWLPARRRAACLLAQEPRNNPSATSEWSGATGACGGPQRAGNLTTGCSPARASEARPSNCSAHTGHLGWGLVWRHPAPRQRRPLLWASWCPQPNKRRASFSNAPTLLPLLMLS